VLDVQVRHLQENVGFTWLSLQGIGILPRDFTWDFAWCFNVLVL